MSASIVKNLITPSIKKAVTTAGKNTAAQNRAIKNAAKKANMTPAEFKKEAKKVLKDKDKDGAKKPNNKKTLSAEDKTKLKEGTMSKTLTPAQFKKLSPQLKALYKQQLEEMGEGSQNILPRRRATGPEGVKPVQQGPLLSKVQLPEKISPARKRKLIAQGKAKMTSKGLKDTGEFAPSARSIAEEMGIGGRGSLPTEEQLRGMGGFEFMKKGGTIKRRMGGKVRGYGKALRGY
tara:strand:+ start:83 stop:784 length:702 start_codon:yes stop_codon:yes gene_type:complete